MQVSKQNGTAFAKNANFVDKYLKRAQTSDMANSTHISKFILNKIVCKYFDLTAILLKLCNIGFDD